MAQLGPAALVRSFSASYPGNIHILLTAKDAKLCKRIGKINLITLDKFLTTCTKVIFSHALLGQKKALLFENCLKSVKTAVTVRTANPVRVHYFVKSLALELNELFG